ncbi:MAG: TIGR03943 family protein [Actinomycetota bacterium]|nr:TIGR03943 family protein [Actinomycetota bacterium]
MSVQSSSQSRTVRPRSATTPRPWSPVRLAEATALGAWAGLFWYLLPAGRSALYLSSRTSWVVPLGAILLTLGAVGRLAGARARAPEPLALRHALGIGLTIVPVVAVLALPSSALGSYAASKRSSFVSSGYLASPEDVASGQLSLADIAGALQSQGGARALARRAGSQVSLVGFVTKEAGMPADEFILTRFLVSCCVADALSVQVRVVGAPPGDLKTDQWVRVEGALYPLENEALVDASKVVRVERPARPYLNP